MNKLDFSVTESKLLDLSAFPIEIRIETGWPHGIFKKSSITSVHLSKKVFCYFKQALLLFLSRWHRRTT